jgi:hypothetical protein
VNRVGRYGVDIMGNRLAPPPWAVPYREHLYPLGAVVGLLVNVPRLAKGKPVIDNGRI